MQKIDYNATKNYWDNVRSRGIYSMGYHMDDEELAKYRFRKELIVLNKHRATGGNYLDLGCGTGNYLCEFKNFYNNLVGIDFSSLLINVAKNRCAGCERIHLYNDNIINYLTYINNLNLGGLDYIFVGGVFAYLEISDAKQVAKQMWQSLNPGGVIILREPTASKKTIFENVAGYYIYRRRVREYIDLFSECNYQEMIVMNNYVTSYVSAIAKYRAILKILRKLSINFWENILIEFLFLFLPTAILIKLRNNKNTYHYIIIKK